MKAKLYIFGEKFEIKLADDTVHTPKKNESKEKFLERIKKVVNDEHLDDEFDVIEIDEATVALNDAATLTAALEGATGLQKKLIEAALAKATPKEAKVKKEKIAAVSIEDAKASESYKEAEDNIGKFASFSPFKSEEVFEGKIAGVALNKTNTILYYTIVEANGKRRCCGVLNPSVKLIDEPAGFKKEPKPVKETKAAKAAKEAATASVTDATTEAVEGDELM
jgi:hypothetical protein